VLPRSEIEKLTQLEIKLTEELLNPPEKHVEVNFNE
jgi:hypothetical protein